MEFFFNIAKEILTESANITTVSGAIRKRCEAIINYESDDENARGERTIQPVAYGLSKAGNLVVRAFQPYGDTKTKVPHWKLFRLDKITSWKTLWGNIFDEPPGFFNTEGRFNPNGDGSMSQVYLVANFERSREFKAGKRGRGLYAYNQKRNEKKKEEQPLYDLQRNISKSIKPKYVLDRINKYPSQQAKNYVDNNEKYKNDLERVDNIPQYKQQVNEPVTRDNVKQNGYTPQEKNNVVNSGPEMKNDENNENEKRMYNGV